MHSHTHISSHASDAGDTVLAACLCVCSCVVHVCVCARMYDHIIFTCLTTRKVTLIHTHISSHANNIGDSAIAVCLYMSMCCTCVCVCLCVRCMCWKKPTPYAVTYLIVKCDGVNLRQKDLLTLLIHTHTSMKFTMALGNQSMH